MIGPISLRVECAGWVIDAIKWNDAVHGDARNSSSDNPHRNRAILSEASPQKRYRLPQGLTERCETAVEVPLLLAAIAAGVADGPQFDCRDLQSPCRVHDGCAFHGLGKRAGASNHFSRRGVGPAAGGHRG